MERKGVSFSVFTKMWKDNSPTELGEFVLDLGFDGIELPVRAGYPVPPERVGRDLPKAAKYVDENGQLRGEGTFVMGSGKWIEFDPTGKKTQERLYRNGAYIKAVPA